jgi:anti-anti-sigma factor
MTNSKVEPASPVPTAKTALMQNCRYRPPAQGGRIHAKQRTADTACGRRLMTRPAEADAYLAGQLGATRLIAVCGEVDLSTAEGLDRRLQALAGPPPQRIILDLSRVDFIDCAGLRALEGVARLVRRDNGSMCIGETSRPAALLLDLAEWPGWE